MYPRKYLSRLFQYTAMAVLPVLSMQACVDDIEGEPLTPGERAIALALAPEGYDVDKVTKELLDDPDNIYIATANRNHIVFRDPSIHSEDYSEEMRGLRPDSDLREKARADVIAHELWHTIQHQLGITDLPECPSNLEAAYQFNIDDIYHMNDLCHEQQAVLAAMYAVAFWYAGHNFVDANDDDQLDDLDRLRELMETGNPGIGEEWGEFLVDNPPAEMPPFLEDAEKPGMQDRFQPYTCKHFNP